ncbi:RNA methyltransferase [Brevundimonas mediterranea]|uniref:RNA methyltransferase n=1 Tax=Brevundimonas mediterranea TaxID=74329 RepID=A0AB37EAL6_9CAUL|nr:RNA methyltransferase [Brevundimonas mediterranea]
MSTELRSCRPSQHDRETSKRRDERRSVWRNSRRDGIRKTRAFHCASSTPWVIWTGSANSHTGQRSLSDRINRPDRWQHPTTCQKFPKITLALKGASTDEKPVAPPVEHLLAAVADEDVFVIASGIGNHDNMGGVFRNAAAFGARAVLLDETCCDPFYRKAIRVSVGAVLRSPFTVGGSAEDLVAAMQTAGVEVLALTPSATLRLADYRPQGPVALMVGSEGPGLPRVVIDRCRAVGVPMAGGFDSLNVAVTSALALHHVTSGRPAG